MIRFEDSKTDFENQHKNAQNIFRFPNAWERILHRPFSLGRRVQKKIPWWSTLEERVIVLILIGQVWWHNEVTEMPVPCSRSAVEANQDFLDTFPILRGTKRPAHPGLPRFAEASLRKPVHFGKVGGWPVFVRFRIWHFFMCLLVLSIRLPRDHATLGAQVIMP